MKTCISILCEFGITCAAGDGLDKNTLIYVLKNVVSNFICNETFPCFEGRSGFPCLASNPK